MNIIIAKKTIGKLLIIKSIIFSTEFSTNVSGSGVFLQPENTPVKIIRNKRLCFFTIANNFCKFILILSINILLQY